MFAFMGAEVRFFNIFFAGFCDIFIDYFVLLQCLILAIRTLHVLIRYGMFLYDMRQGAINNDCEFQKKFKVEVLEKCKKYAKSVSKISAELLALLCLEFQVEN
jgi:hypothetical protein